MSSLIRLGRFVIQRTSQNGNSLNYSRNGNRLCNFQNQSFPSHLQNVRYMSGKGGFISNLIENIKNEMDKNKEMKDSIKKFREEAQKLEESDSLKKARDKFNSIESEAAKGSDTLKQKISDLHEKVSQSEYAKKSKEIVGDVADTVSKAAESVSKHSEHITQSGVYKTVSNSVQSMTQDIKETTLDDRRALYRVPVKLRKRDDHSLKMDAKRPIRPDDKSTEVVMNKESQWQQNWEKFKNNNPLFNKVFDMKTKYEESDNVIVRATRSVADVFTGLFGGLFSTTEISAVLTEIKKIDSTFNEEDFLRLCQFDFIPNILEAQNRGDLEILKDWCYEAVYNILSEPIKQAKALNYTFNSAILDINRVELLNAKILDQGPVIVVGFDSQVVSSLRDATGMVIEGDPDQPVTMRYMFVFCRDQEVFDPKAAWKLVDFSAQNVGRVVV